MLNNKGEHKPCAKSKHAAPAHPTLDILITPTKHTPICPIEE